MAAIPNLEVYQGTSSNVAWNTASNWSGGVVPGAANTALFTHNAVLSGPIEVGTLMLIGSETVSINGAIKTDSTNVCESFMVCQDSNVTFNAGSSLTDAGGFEVGVHGVGSVTVDGASGSLAAASLHVANLKIGQFTGGVGTLTLAGGSVSVVAPCLVGLAGQGTLNMSGTSTLTANGLGLGAQVTGSGHLNMSGNASAYAASWIDIGTAVAGGIGGTGAVALSGNASLACRDTVTVGAGSSVTMAGGTLSAGIGGMGLVVDQGGTVSGNGTIVSASHGVTVNGSLESAGGTLMVTGNLSGMGKVEIGAGSTLDLVASKISAPTLSFMGSTGTLELAPEVGGAFSIAGFQAGDQLLVAGIDHASWNGTTDVLSLSEHGQVMDQLHLTGVAANAAFSVTPGIGGSMIALVPSHH